MNSTSDVRGTWYISGVATTMSPLNSILQHSIKSGGQRSLKSFERKKLEATWTQTSRTIFLHRHPSSTSCAHELYIVRNEAESKTKKRSKLYEKRQRSQLMLLCLEPDVTESTGYSYVSTNSSIDNLIEWKKINRFLSKSKVTHTSKFQ